MKTSLLLLSVFLSVVLYANINYMHGISGMTLRDGGTGCICHNDHPSDSVMVWIEGPDTVFINDTINYKLFMSGGPAITGGFNVASYIGLLDTTDSLTQLIFGELTHKKSKHFINDTLFWDFLYIAPDSIVSDTLYATANSTNNDSIPTSLDQWNHAENFAVNVIDEPVFVKDKNVQPDEFVLYQNYPNPFNPVTKIKFTIPTPTVSSPLVNGKAMEEFVTVKVYDILGSEVETLLTKELSAGNYEVQFNGDKVPGGIYFYQLNAGSFNQTKKMVLLK